MTAHAAPIADGAPSLKARTPSTVAAPLFARGWVSTDLKDFFRPAWDSLNGGISKAWRSTKGTLVRKRKTQRGDPLAGLSQEDLAKWNAAADSWIHDELKIPRPARRTAAESPPASTEAS